MTNDEKLTRAVQVLGLIRSGTETSAGMAKVLPWPVNKLRPILHWLEELGVIKDLNGLKAGDRGHATTKGKRYQFASDDAIPIKWPRPAPEGNKTRWIGTPAWIF